ncbi:nucleotidyltransferase domain-containing protein [bacterium]|nr:nucleotidyltransferase domain-containing protein [bacterium]
MLGVTEKELEIIKNILMPFREDYNFFAYGSRVKGNFRPLSDLDLMIKGENLAELTDIENLKEKFDNSSLPYIVNLVDYFSLTESFYSIIKKDLIKI